MTTQEYIKCENCGFIFPVSIPTPQELSEFYVDWESAKPSYKSSVIKQYKLTMKKRVGILRKYIPSGKLLDVGCGGGYFLYAAREAGFQVEGLEINTCCVEWARKYLNLPVREGTFKDMEYTGKFDVIILSQVLEHMLDPKENLLRSNFLLKKGGILHISVPNTSALIFLVKNMCHLISFRKKLSAPVYPPVHLYGFTPKALCILLEKTGFQVLDIFTIPAGDKVYWPITWRRELTVKRLLEDVIDEVIGRFINRAQFIILYAQKIRDI